MAIKIKENNPENQVFEGQYRIVKRFILFPKTLNNITVYCQFIHIKQLWCKSYSPDDNNSYFCSDKEFILDENLSKEQKLIKRFNREYREAYLYNINSKKSFSHDDFNKKFNKKFQEKIDNEENQKFKSEIIPYQNKKLNY